MCIRDRVYNILCGSCDFIFGLCLGNFCVENRIAVSYTHLFDLQPQELNMGASESVIRRWFSLICCLLNIMAILFALWKSERHPSIGNMCKAFWNSWVQKIWRDLSRWATGLLWQIPSGSEMMRSQRLGTRFLYIATILMKTSRELLLREDLPHSAVRHLVSYTHLDVYKRQV